MIPKKYTWDGRSKDEQARQSILCAELWRSYSLGRVYTHNKVLGYTLGNRVELIRIQIRMQLCSLEYISRVVK